MDIVEYNFHDYLFSTDVNKLSVKAIHDFLSIHSEWSRNISLDNVKISISNSLNFGLLHQGNQIVFARIISDYATIAYLGDVYVLDNYRGQGFSKKLMEVVLHHPNLQGLRSWILLTSTADWLYGKYGFTHLSKPEIYMDEHNPEVYSFFLE